MTIRGIPMSKRWTPKTAPDESQAVVRALVGALEQVRSGEVLADRHQKSLRCAIGDLRSIVKRPQSARCC